MSSSSSSAKEIKGKAQIDTKEGTTEEETKFLNPLCDIVKYKDIEEWLKGKAASFPEDCKLARLQSMFSVYIYMLTS